jgi:hypothetical protein
LDALRSRYPDGSYVEETLYLIVRFFGWSVAISRYGPYTQDPEVIRLTAACRRVFASTGPQRPVGPFNFFIPEQKALGKLVMHSLEGEFGRELGTISFYELKELMEKPPLAGSPALGQTLEALRSARNADDLGGRERLAEALGLLVDLLSYLEARECYNLFPGERLKCLDVPVEQPRTARARGARPRQVVVEA